MYLQSQALLALRSNKFNTLASLFFYYYYLLVDYFNLKLDFQVTR